MAYQYQVTSRDIEVRAGNEPLSSDQESASDGGESSEDDEPDTIPLDGDVYGAAITSLMRDMSRTIDSTKAHKLLRVTNIVITFSMLLFATSLQAILVYLMKTEVCSMDVKEIRELYGEYEMHMYGGIESHTYKTVNGNRRGKPEFFNASRFDTFEGDKDKVCKVPLSQPMLTFPVLLVWTLTVTAEIKKAVNLTGSLLFATPTVASHTAMLKTQGDNAKAMVISGITLPLKIIIGIFIIVPRFFIDGVLLWLGCRWLVATADFGDIILNAVALEFILIIKELLYGAVVPARNQREVSNTLINPWNHREPTNCFFVLAAFGNLVVAIVWVTLYMLKFQRVLPDYQWDVREVCSKFLAEQRSK